MWARRGGKPRRARRRAGGDQGGPCRRRRPAIGAENLSKPVIAEAIGQAQAGRGRRTGITRGRVPREVRDADPPGISRAGDRDVEAAGVDEGPAGIVSVRMHFP